MGLLEQFTYLGKIDNISDFGEGRIIDYCTG